MAPSINYSASCCNCNHTGFSGFVYEQSKIRVEEREQYEKDLKAFAMAAMQGFVTCSKSGEDWNLGMIADWSIHMAVVQLDYIKKHLNNG